MHYRKYKPTGSGLQSGLEYLQRKRQKSQVWRYSTVEAALMTALNVKIREHKEAQLDNIGFIVHITVEDKNASMNHSWGPNSDQAIKATPLECADQNACHCDSYVRHIQLQHVLVASKHLHLEI
jgi:hypothetical protein